MRIVQAGLVGYLLLRLGLFVSYCAQVMSYPFEICAGEGILLNQARLLAAGKTIYPAVGDYPFLISHFTPVVPALLAVGVRVVGIAFWPGRLLTFLSTLAVGAAVCRVASTGSRRRWQGAVAGLLFATSSWIALSSVEVCVDMLAAAFSAWGVCVAVRSRGLRRDVTAAVLLALAVLTRQTQVAGLAAVCWWLWQRDRRAACRVAGLWLALVAAAVLAIEAASRGQFHKHVVTHTAGTLSLGRLWLFARAYARVHLALAALVGWFVWQQWRRREVGLAGAYLVASYAVAATCARQGSGQTYFIEAIAASCLAGGIALGRLSVEPRVRPWLVLAATIAVIALTEEAWYRSGTVRPPSRQQRQQTSALLAELKRRGPPLLAEYNGLVLQAGGELLFQPYAFRMLASKGRWRDDVLVEDIRRGKFSAIVVSQDARLARSRWTPGVLEAMDASYRGVGAYRLYRHIGETRVLLLRPTGKPGASKGQ